MKSTFITRKGWTTLKIDRLLAIITYLLNRDIVSGKHLAEKFEVTERTIQRDVDTINMAGIPIVSIRGAGGGYKIIDTYKFSKQPSNEEDMESITLALKSLYSALENEKISNTLEKVKSICPKKPSNNINVDFSIVKENKKIAKYIKIIDEAILNKHKIEFLYVNAVNYSRDRIIEPVSLEFKWYSWYLVAYCTEKKDYRIFKLIRMDNLKLTEIQFTNNHDNNGNLFDELMSNDSRKYINLLFKCSKTSITAVSEYMPGVKFTKITENDYRGELTVAENERMWFAFLLSFGEDIEVIEPESVKQRLVEHSQKIIDKYNW